MPKLTALTPHPRKAGRYSVLVDGIPVPATVSPRRTTRQRSDRPDPGPPPALLDAAAIHALGLKVGGELSDSALAALAQAAELVDATDRALAMLALRSHSTGELNRKLSQKGTAGPVIDAVLTRLSESGLIDDLKFAEHFARSRLAGRGQSRRRVAAEMAKRGISRSTADQALASVTAEEGIDEVAAARKAAQKKLKGLSGKEPEVARRRLAGYLLRQGFGGEIVRLVTSQLLDRVLS